MSAPWGWDRRGDRGPVGLLARWWCARRVRRIKKALNHSPNGRNHS